MKKFTTKLLMSIIAVAFAFVALGTSTYAWFSMNQTVTATGMEVGVKSNSTYLLISKTNDTAVGIQGENITTVSLAPAQNENTKVLPSKPKQASEVAADGTAIDATSIAAGKYFVYGTDVVADATSAAVEANWYTAVSHNPSQALAFESGADFKSLNDTANDPLEFSKYVIKKTVYLTLAEGSNDAYHLSVTPTIAAKDTYKKTADTALQQKTYYTRSGDEYTAVASPDVANIGTYYEKVEDITAVRVLVAVGDKVAILSSTSGAQDLFTLDTDNVLTDSTVLTADIYIYYDGSQSVVTTNNSADLSDATIDLAFNVALKPANN